MMVLSASSVNAYLSFDDSYFYVKRQLIFLGVGVLGAFTIMKLPPSTLRLLSWFGVALAAILLILTYTPLIAVLHTARGVREAGHDHLGS